MKSGLRYLICLFWCFVFIDLTPDSASADFPELLKQVPSSANALIVIKTKEIGAKATGSNRREIDKFLKAARFWPAIKGWNPERVLIAAEMDIQHMEPQWEMAAVEFEQKPDLKMLATSTNGVTDNLLGFDVVWLENACLLATGEKRLTLVTPLNRQSATRWLRRIKQQTSIEISPFLREVAEAASSGSADITLAVDLENIFAPTQVSELVERNPLFEKLDTNPTDILCGIRGVVVQCQVGAEAKSAINFEFSESVESLAPIAKPMMIQALAKAGAMPTALGSWKAETSGKQISLQGTLSSTGLQRVLSLASIGAVIAHADATQPPENPANAQEAAAADAEYARLEIIRATKKYFGSVKEVVADIEKNFDRKGLDQNALWINNYARQIDRLSTRKVDADMIAYGQYVAKSLTAMVGGFHQANDAVRASMSQATPVFGGRTVTNVPIRRYNIGGHRQFEYAPMVSQNLNLGYAIQDRRAIRDAGRYDANQAAYDILKQIDDATAKIREAMSKKYNEDF